MKNCKIKNHLIRSVHCWFLLRFLVPNIFVLAIFSQLPPLGASRHLHSINTYFFRQLFSIYDMNVLPCALFQNQPFGSYLLSPLTNWKFFCRYLLHFVSYFIHPSNLFGNTSAQSLRNFFTMDKTWICRQNVALIFKFSYRYTYLGLP